MNHSVCSQETGTEPGSTPVLAGQVSFTSVISGFSVTRQEGTKGRESEKLLVRGGYATQEALA